MSEIKNKVDTAAIIIIATSLIIAIGYATAIISILIWITIHPIQTIAFAEAVLLLGTIGPVSGFMIWRASYVWGKAHNKELQKSEMVDKPGTVT